MASKTDKPIILTLSDEEFLTTEATLLALHGHMCDGQLDNCIRCGELACPEGTCGVGGGWIQTYRATLIDPAEYGPACASHDPEANGYYEDGDY